MPHPTTDVDINCPGKLLCKVLYATVNPIYNPMGYYRTFGICRKLAQNMRRAETYRVICQLQWLESPVRGTCLASKRATWYSSGPTVP